MNTIDSIISSYDFLAHVREEDIFIGDQKPQFTVLQHNFNLSYVFPQVKDGKSIGDLVVSAKDAPETVRELIQKIVTTVAPHKDQNVETVLKLDDDVNLTMSYKTTATVTFVADNAGYTNSVGFYTVAADGTISNVSMLFARDNTSIGKSVTVDMGDAGSSFGLFLVADGFTQNKEYQGINFAKDQISFIYNLGKADERAANITDNAKNISLVVQTAANKIIVIKGDIYHTTLNNQNAQINPDGKVHALSGLADLDDPSTLRIGFEDLKNLGDADFDDAVLDITIASHLIDHSQNYLDDRIYAGVGEDIILGGLGNDELRGGAGRDYIEGNEGNDYLLGDAGDDIIYGGTGSDEIHGGTGDDLIYGGEDNDRLYGGEDNDTVYGEDGDDYLNGFTGDDVLHGGAGNDDVYGGAGHDTLHGGDGNDRLYGESGDDILHGDEGDDLLLGGDGNDVLQGGNGRDTLQGGNGQDILYGDAGDDVLNGDADNDTLYGGDGADELRGAAGHDTLYGDAGDDIIYGGDGNDVLIGGAGYDRLYGNAGADTFVFLAEGTFDARDQIYDFSVAQGDKIDISDILSSYYDPLTNAITDFVRITSNGTHSFLKVDIDGAGNAHGFVDVAQLTRVTNLDDVTKLVADGTLIV